MKRALAVVRGRDALASGAFSVECPADQVTTGPSKIETASDIGVVERIAQDGAATRLRDTGSVHQPGRHLTTAPQKPEDRAATVLVQGRESGGYKTRGAQPAPQVAGGSILTFALGLRNLREDRADEPVIPISTNIAPGEWVNDRSMKMH